MNPAPHAPSTSKAEGMAQNQRRFKISTSAHASKSDFYQKMDKFKEGLTQNDRNAATPDEITQLENWEHEAEAIIHTEWISRFAKKFTR